MTNGKKSTKFAGLSQAAGRKPPPAEPEPPARGRRRGTSEDAGPVTLHLSEEIVRKARMKLLSDADKRPLSRIVELLLNGWTSGNQNI